MSAPRPQLRLLLSALSRCSASSNTQWSSWSAVRRLATHAIISAEAAKAVSQHGGGLVQMPADMLQSLDSYLADAGLKGKHAKARAAALTDKLKALSRSTAVGGLQPYRTPDAAMEDTHAAAAAAAAADHAMTPEQLAEQQAMDADLEKMAASLGPGVLADVRRIRAAAAHAATVALPRTRGGRIKASAKAALEEHIAQHGVLGLPHEAVRVAFDLPPTSSLGPSPAQLAALKAATPAYNDSQALAYALSRLPGCFAASSRIFRELRVRQPGFAPRSMLDFGAGPGTAGWAAQEAWPASLSRLTAVEPSSAMQQLGMRLEAARRFAHPTAPLVRWRSELPPAALSARKKQQQQTHDLVVASYVLGELPTQAERNAYVRRLWGLTGDMLVLVEPGTPAGSANIQEARATVLQYEARRVSKLQQRIAAGDTTAGREAGDHHDRSSSSSNSDHNLPAKAASRWFGAHVVSPCPHDGPCPLAVAGSKSWCHFGTRFQRPGFMQEAKAPPGRRVNAADFQDERYSYVVLRRGVRQSAVPEVDISRSFEPKHRGGLMPPASPALLDSSSSDASSSTGLMDSGSDSSSNDEATLHTVSAQQHGSFSGGPVTHAQQQQPSGRRARPSALFDSEELLQLSAALGPSSPSHWRQQQRQDHAGIDSSSNDGEQPSSHAAAGGKLQGYGPGLVDRLMALEDAGMDWASAGTGLAPELAVSAVSRPAGSPSGQQTATQQEHQQEEQYASDSWQSDKDKDGDSDDGSAAEMSAPSEQQHELDLSVASAASAAWSRIIRPPRKRGGHVILDVCAPASEEQPLQAQSGGRPSRGHIIRHVVARSDTAKWMGKAAYQMAQHAHWGDLWPSFYNRNAKQQVVK